MKTPQETLDEVAKEKGYEDWKKLQSYYVYLIDTGVMEDVKHNCGKEFTEILHESMRRYAETEKQNLFTKGCECGDISTGAMWCCNICGHPTSTPSPSWVSDEEIKKESRKNEIVCHSDCGEGEAFKIGAKWARSVIFKEGKPKEDGND